MPTQDPDKALRAEFQAERDRILQTHILKTATRTQDGHLYARINGSVVRLNEDGTRYVRPGKKDRKLKRRHA